MILHPAVVPGSEERGPVERELDMLTIGAPARESLADKVTTILKRYILVEHLEAGARMPAERQLANTLNVSRTVLREALNRLIGEGLLERRSPRTLQVAPYDREALAASLLSIDERARRFLDMMELRYVLEMGALPLVVARATPEQIAEIEHRAAEFRRHVMSGQAVHQMDALFHASLLRVLGNPTIDVMVPLIEAQIREYLYFDPRLLRSRYAAVAERVMNEHDELVEAIRRRDAAAARDAMERHLAPYFDRLQRLSDTSGG
jgi:DNA-binding FadR family transcriptional regulator